MAARIAGDDVLVLADTDHEGRTLAGHHQHVRLLLAQHGDRVRARHLPERSLDRPLQVSAIQLTDQVAKHLGIRLAGEDVPLLLQVLLEDRVVLDDAVVDHGDPVTPLHVVAVRVGVGLRDPAMGGPAGVGHPHTAREPPCAPPSPPAPAPVPRSGRSPAWGSAPRCLRSRSRGTPAASVPQEGCASRASGRCRR